MIQEAKEFAFEAHKGQTYGDGRPYYVHLEDVVGLLGEHGCDYPDRAIAAGYLHDVIEDCKVDPATLTAKFGVEVTQMVLFCTDETGINRRERKAKTYARMRRDIEAALVRGQIPVEGWLRDAIRVKLADRLANIGSCFRGDRPDLWQMYWKERQAFDAALGGTLSDFAHSMWDEYERLLSRPPEGMEKALRARAQTTGFAKQYGGSEVASLTPADAVSPGDVTPGPEGLALRQIENAGEMYRQRRMQADYCKDTLLDAVLPLLPEAVQKAVTEVRALVRQTEAQR